jgi:hypothetical protein
LHRLAEIADANLRGIDLPACGTGDHDGQLASFAESDHRHLGANLVDGVDHDSEIVIEHGRHVVGVTKSSMQRTAQAGLMARSRSAMASTFALP